MIVYVESNFILELVYRNSTAVVKNFLPWLKTAAFLSHCHPFPFPKQG